jgi:hypothetical protein
MMSLVSIFSLITTEHRRDLPRAHDDQPDGYFLVYLLFALVAFLRGPLAAADAIKPVEQSTLYVQIRSAALREKPEHFARSVATSRYGDMITIQRLEGAWYFGSLKSHVEDAPSAVAGYVHKSALTPRVVVLGARRDLTSAEAISSDVVLAGKGFTLQVEEAYAAREPGLAYTAVAALEKRSYRQELVTDFVRDGGLLE